MSAIGKPMDRVDGRQKVTGAAKYAAEYPVKDVAYAFPVQSTIAKGKITAIDTAAAEKLPGVLVVLTHKNCPKMKAVAVFDPASKSPKAGATSAAILQTDEVFWNGQPVALVVADSFERARHAAELVKVTYEAKPAAVDFEAEKARAFVPDNVLGEKPEIEIGDAEKALAEAAFQVDHTYTTPRHNHNPIEPHATLAHWEGDRLTVYDASQFLYGVRLSLAEKFGLPDGNVRVIGPFVGGGFGGKGLMWPHVELAAAAAKAVGRPVKLALTREQMYGQTGYRTPTEQRVALGCDKDGKLTALVHTGATVTSTTNTFTEQFTFPARHLYASPNIHLLQKIAKLDVTPPTFMRAPGETPGTFALESALDELSYALKLDPVELRLRNDPDKDPTSGHPFSHRKFKEAYQLGAEKFGWAKRNPAPKSTKDGRWLVGQGVATAFYPVYQNPSAASVQLAADGTAVVRSACHDMGMGTGTVQTQNAADCLGLPVEKVKFEWGDTALPFAAVAGGSSQTISIGAAVAAACEALKAKLIALAADGSPLKGAKADQVVFADGKLAMKGRPDKGEPLVDLVRRAGKAVSADAKGDPGDKLKKMSMQSYGAQFCEVRVDPDLGEVRVTRWLGAFDCGRILNPKTARSQFIGGITMGIGMALMEETHVDRRNGRAVNRNLAEYLVPTHADVPAIEAVWLDDPDPHTPMGAHGIGEIGITGAAAAIANAVFHATGKRVRDLPIRSEKLL